jgi:hypothetical protein
VSRDTNLAWFGVLSFIAICGGAIAWAEYTDRQAAEYCHSHGGVMVRSPRACIKGERIPLP